MRRVDSLVLKPSHSSFLITVAHSNQDHKAKLIGTT